MFNHSISSLVQSIPLTDIVVDSKKAVGIFLDSAISLSFNYFLTSLNIKCAMVVQDFFEKTLSDEVANIAAFLVVPLLSVLENIALYKLLNLRFESLPSLPVTSPLVFSAFAAAGCAIKILQIRKENMGFYLYA